MRKKLTFDEFLNRANIVHEHKYDYSKVNFVDSKTPVTVICKQHGEFQIKPNAHYGGPKSGCKVCSGQKTVDTEEFIARSNKIHNEKYDYSKVVCTGITCKVEIICREHGVFSLRASEHYGKSQRGCPRCTTKPKSKNIKDTESFKMLAVAKYGDKYDYSKSEYTGATNKITITCREHGDFQIRPNAHTGAQSQGCPACGNRPKMSTEALIKKSKELYGDRFEYNKASYINTETKVTITCKKHGDFQIKPNNHYKGNGGELDFV